MMDLMSLPEILMRAWLGRNWLLNNAVLHITSMSLITLAGDFYSNYKILAFCQVAPWVMGKLNYHFQYLQQLALYLGFWVFAGCYMSPRSGFELGLKRDRSYFYF